MDALEGQKSLPHGLYATVLQILLSTFLVVWILLQAFCNAHLLLGHSFKHLLVEFILLLQATESHLNGGKSSAVGHDGSRL